MADPAHVAPELRPFLDLFPPLDFSNGIAAFRAPLQDRPVVPVPPELAAIVRSEHWIPGLGQAPDVRVVCYSPPGEAMRPAILHMHGGGYVLGNPEFNDLSNRARAQNLQCLVASVDYRLAPETRFPGALEDCYAALLWLNDRPDVDRIAVAGESAGGGHAAALAIYARDRGGPAICFQLLDSPMLDDRTQEHPHCGQFIWTVEHNRFGWGALLGDGDVPAGAVPARVEDLSGLPPTFIAVGALDLFLDENLEYARRLARAGVAVELHVTPGAYHGFGIAQASPQALAVARLAREATQRAFSRTAPDATAGTAG